MKQIVITHYPNCTANYPEKPEGEAPQHILKIDIDDNEVVYQCSDCGAYIVVEDTDANNEASQGT